MTGFISTSQMYRVMDQMLNNVEVTEEGPGVEEFKVEFAKDMETAKRNGWVIDIPSDPAYREDIHTSEDGEEVGDNEDETETKDE